MAKPHAQNERIKRAYFSFLREAHGRDVATVDAVAKSLARFGSRIISQPRVTTSSG